MGNLYDYGFGKTWKDYRVIHRSGYTTSVTGYHKHDFYEINLILSGNVNILLSEGSVSGTGSFLVATAPGMPHYVSCKSDIAYRRIFLVFSEGFVKGYFPEWHSIASFFGKNGAILKLGDEDAKAIHALIRGISEEKDSFRVRLLIYYLLSRLSEGARERGGSSDRTPQYVIDALSYIEDNFQKHFSASQLAAELHIGRTALMTEFKKHTGSTLGEYLTRCRHKNALKLLGEGLTQEEAADKCGFSDGGGLNRSFKKVYGVTPRQYLLSGKSRGDDI